MDVRTITEAVSLAATKACWRSWPHGLFRAIWGDPVPRPFSGGDREAAVDIHQLRAGHYTRSRQYMHRIGPLPHQPPRRVPRLRA